MTPETYINGKNVTVKKIDDVSFFYVEDKLSMIFKEDKLYVEAPNIKDKVIRQSFFKRHDDIIATLMSWLLLWIFFSFDSNPILKCIFYFIGGMGLTLLIKSITQFVGILDQRRLEHNILTSSLAKKD